MSAENDGGPAFPVTYESYGMSLRDWFAGQALATLGTAMEWEGTDSSGIARAAYKIADAMLAERSKEGAK